MEHSSVRFSISQDRINCAAITRKAQWFCMTYFQKYKSGAGVQGLPSKGQLNNSGSATITAEDQQHRKRGRQEMAALASAQK
jgi:hypothetical protein